MRLRVPAVVAAVAGVMLVSYGAAPGLPASAAAGQSSCPWVGSSASPMTKADEVLAQMTLAEKITMMGGQQNPGGYEGYIPGDPRLCIPPLTQEDGPAGAAAGVTGVTQLPAPIAAAASWDRSLVGQYGALIGNEEWGKGVEVALAPDINNARVPENGRTFEAFGEDPYLTGQMAIADIDGIQSQGVIAQVKHFAMNNQEDNRTVVSENADPRTMHEIELAGFQAAVQQAHVGSVMCAYNKVNGVYSCENPDLLTQILRDQWGFPGWVGSDYYATHSTIAAANAGLDMEMPYQNYFGAPLQQAVADGQVSMATIDSAVRSILYEMFRFGLFDHQPTGTRASVVTSPAHATFARTAAEQSAVLLKNQGGLLPLDASKLHSVAVIGDDAGQDALTATPPPSSALVNPPYIVTPLQGITSRAGPGVQVNYAQGIAPASGALPAVPASAFPGGLSGQFYSNMALTGSPVLTRIDPNVDFNWNGNSPGSGVGATQWSAKWTGTIDPPATGSYTFSLTSDDGSRLFINGQQVISMWQDQAATTQTATVNLTAGQPASVEVDYYQDGGASSLSLGWQPPGGDLIQQAAATAAKSDVAVVFAADPESEGTDLPNLELPGQQNQLISAVAAANPNTIVVLNTASPVTMPWLDQVKGVFEAWYPGQEDGNAIAALLFGDVNPSGHLPITFPTSDSATPIQSPQQYPGVNGEADYTEGVDVGYRWYDAHNVTPLFPFGYGLSYTSFAFSHLVTAPGQLSPNGHETVSAEVTNTGTRAGADVVQLYIGDPSASGEPPRQLKGFQKVFLQPGQTTTVHFTLSDQDGAYWDDNAHGWVTPAGTYQVMVGDSSAILPLTGSFTVPRTLGPRYVTVQAPATSSPRSTVTVSTSFVNGSDLAVQHASVALSVPAGWTATATSPSSFQTVGPQQTVTTTWQVSIPPDATSGTYPLTATADYHGESGAQQATGQASTGLPGTASIGTVLGQVNQDYGLSQIEEPFPGDGSTQPVTIGGLSGRETTVSVPDDFNIYFNVDDSIAYNGSYTATFTFQYYDQGTGSFELQYDSTNPNGGPFSGAYTSGIVVQETGTNTWKTVTYTVPDAHFANRENGGADFRLTNVSNDPFTLHSMAVTISGIGVASVSPWPNNP